MSRARLSPKLFPGIKSLAKQTKQQESKNMEAELTRLEILITILSAHLEFG